MKKSVITKALAAVTTLGLIGGLTACSNSADETTQTVRLGVIGASEPYWAAYETAVEEELDIDLQLVDFGEYPLPNPALSNNDIDINQFQHIIYLAQHNQATGDDLVPIGSTAIYPLSLHSLKYDSVDEIPAGSKIAIPNDPSNKARALLVLQQAGLIELKDGGSTNSTADDILPSSKVEVTELEAAFTATSLNDVAGAVINNDFIEKAGLDFENALFKDDPSDPSSFPYINIFAVRAEDENNETLLKLVEIYHDSQEVLDGLQEASGGTAVITKTSKDDLKASLADQIELITAAE